MATHLGKYFSITRLDDRKGKRWRVRFMKKPLKLMGVNLQDKTAKEIWKNERFVSKRDAEKHGNSLVDQALRVNKGARGLPQKEKDKILELAAHLKEHHIDPLKALQIGSEHLEGRSYDSLKKLKEFWKSYKASRVRSRKWSPRVQRQKEKFFENTEKHFLQHSLSAFRTRKRLATAISEEVSRFMKEGNRNSENTQKKHISNLASFLTYVTHAAEDPFVTPKLIKELFSEEGRLSVLKLPEGLEAEQANKKLTPEMARVFAKEMAQLGPPFSTFMVLKLFAGQRTLNLWHWKWEWIDWSERKINIPLKFTKNKQSDVEFGFKEIPCFSEWIEFVFKQTNPNPKDKLMTHTQPWITGNQTRILNKHSEIFTFADGKKINGSKHVRNILRNSFISYGIEEIGIATTMRIVEDRHNLNSYLSATTSGSGNNAKEFYQITPQSLGLE